MFFRCLALIAIIVSVGLLTFHNNHNTEGYKELFDGEVLIFAERISPAQVSVKWFALGRNTTYSLQVRGEHILGQSHLRILDDVTVTQGDSPFSVEICKRLEDKPQIPLVCAGVRFLLQKNSTFPAI